MGGPILRDKTFFFVAYEGFRSVVPGTSSTIVPTADDRRGVLTDPQLHPKPILDPLTKQPFPGNIIPMNRVDPIAANIIGIMPAPNQASLQNYVKNVPTTHPFDQGNVRGDHYFSSFARLVRPLELPTDGCHHAVFCDGR